jgi:hypothetical protein
LGWGQVLAEIQLALYFRKEGEFFGDHKKKHIGELLEQ